LLTPLIEQIVAEKRLQYVVRPEVAVEFQKPPQDIAACVDPKEFQRLLSNLVNNSVEAFERGGSVVLSLSADGEKAYIGVKDDGKGIPEEMLSKLGHKGATHGKSGGNGLGLYHARTAIEGWGGEFGISSQPRSEAPAPGSAVLLDDDLLVHMNWKMAAKAAGVELKAFKTRAELAAVSDGLPRDTPVYIDSDLGDGVRGEDIAGQLHAEGFTDITMATGHDAGRFSDLPWLKVTGKEPPFG
jgi:signal transduction histidine kinase